MSGMGSFAFDGDECAPSSGVTLMPLSANYGWVSFGGAGLAPGASAYFCLEAPATPPNNIGGQQQIPFTINAAPMGLVDRGENGMTGASYTYAAHQFMSTTRFVKLSIGNSSIPRFDERMSLQLNVMTYGVSTSINNGTYWTQDVMFIDTNSSSCPHPICYGFQSELFNDTSGNLANDTFGILGPNETPQGRFAPLNSLNTCYLYYEDNRTGIPIKNCGVLAHQGTCQAQISISAASPYADTYTCYTAPPNGGLTLPFDGLTIPFAVSLKVTTGIQKGGTYNGSPFISFWYQISELSKGSKPGKFIQFDKVYFDNRLAGPTPGKCAITWVLLPKGVRCPAFVVSGDQQFAPAAWPPGWLFNDAEIVLCGFGNGAIATLTSLQAFMKLYHDSAPIPHGYSFGLDTAEGVTDVISSVMAANKQGWTANPGIGADNFEPLY